MSQQSASVVQIVQVIEIQALLCVLYAQQKVLVLVLVSVVMAVLRKVGDVQEATALTVAVELAIGINVVAVELLIPKQRQ